MITHVVMFKFKSEEKSLNVYRVRDLLLELKREIEVLKSLDVGVDFDGSDRAMDLVLICTFESKKELEMYARDPRHLKVVEFIKSVVEYSRVVDYEH